MAAGDTTYDPDQNMVTIREDNDFVLIALPDGTQVVVCGRGLVYLATPKGEARVLDLFKSIPWQENQE